MTTTQPLAGKTALVIGGSRGIGAAIVRRLAADGASIAFTFANAAQKADALVAAVERDGGRAAALKADSADAAALSTAIDAAAATLGGLDILVHNAGLLILGPVQDFSLEDFDRIHAVNVRGVFVAVKAAVPHLRRGGRIVTIGSITRGAARAAGSTIYGTTKAAVARMVRGLAWDLAEQGITINDVQPGPTATDMNPADGPMIEYLIAANPSRRLGRPEEIADLVAYLAGPAPSYINGAGITIDGGFTA